MGPSEYLGFPNELWLILLGYCINGVAQGFIYIPLIPEIIESVYHKERIVEGENEWVDMQINDNASGLYGTFYSIGQIVAPILGGALYDALGFRLTCDILALTCLGYAIIFFFLNVGFTVFKQEREFREQMKEL